MEKMHRCATNLRILRTGLIAAVATGIGMGISSTVTADEFANYRQFFQPIPAISPIPANNTMTEAKIELGKMLFFEPRISGSGIISCATCHNPALGYTDRIPRATGHDGQVGERNTPTALNSGLFGAQFWDGRAATLEDQALGPIEADIEMNMPIDKAVDRLKEFPIYKEKFTAAFGGRDPIKPENMALAIAAFERTLMTPNSPLDRYLVGDDNAMTVQQKRGMKSFVDRGCIACHTGPALTDSRFHRIKVPGSTDMGRFLVTNNEQDRHAFKTPTLRNVALTYPYFNNGGVDNLPEAIQVMAREMLKLELPKREVADIEAFLHALTGEIPEFPVPSLP